jgi:hypothetical protein
MDVLQRIKQLAFERRVEFTEKALDEIEADGLRKSDVVQSLLNAQMITKVLRLTSRFRRLKGDKLYVIKSFDFQGTLIYTKGAIVREPEGDVFYVLVWSKISTYDD